MPEPTGSDTGGDADGMDGPREVREFVRQAFITGAAVMLPLIVTVMVLGFVINFISQQLNPIAGLLGRLLGEPASGFVLKMTAVILLLAVIFVVGVVAERRPGRSGFGALFDTLVSRIPGVGSLYRSIDEMSGMLLDNDTDTFQEVKLVEFPDQGSYAVAFLTADTPDIVLDTTDHEGMVTLFLPMAPNPVMGGHVLHVNEEQVYDVDLSVEEGIQSIVTSGVATGNREPQELPDDMLDRVNRRISAYDETIEQYVDVDELERYATEAETRIEETARETIETARERLDTDGESGSDQGPNGDRTPEPNADRSSGPAIDPEPDADRNE